MKLKVGNYYRTKGGWKAILIWKSGSKDYPIFYAIHCPGTGQEYGPIGHDKDGKAHSQFSVGEPPRYNQNLPADLIEKWIEK